MSMIDEALSYTQLGWPILPVHSFIDGKCTCWKNKCDEKRKGKHPATKNGLKNASTDENQIRQWFANDDRNVAIVTGAISNLVVVDIDPRHGGDDEWDDLIKEFGEVDTLTVKTGGGGYHYYFNYPKNCNVRNNVNLRPGIDIRGEGGYAIAPPSKHKSGNVYCFDIEDELSLDLIHDIPEWLLNVIQRGTNVNSNGREKPVPSNTTSILSGSRNDTLFRLACSLNRTMLSPEAVKVALFKENEIKCVPPLGNEEVSSILKSALNYSAPIHLLPPTMSEEALVGPLGRIAEKFTPYSEAPVSSIYFHLLIAFGNIIGKRATLNNGPIQHSAALFGLVIGRTSKGRKGTSWDMARLALEKIDENWLETCFTSGLSSGEGLAIALNSQQKKNEERLLIVEPEFSQVLKQKQRSGNTLSESLRNMWDGKDINKLTVSNPVSVSNYHLSMIAHITPKEFRDLIGSTEFCNGFLNRLLFCYSDKTKSIPLAEDLPKDLFTSELHYLRATLERLLLSASNRFSLSEEAKELYTDFYHRMDSAEGDEESELEDISARGPSHVFRLALVLAIQNGHGEVKRIDMRAAIAIWEFSVQSISYVLSKKKASADLTKLYQAISQSKQGLTRTQCSKVFNNHKTKDQLDELLGQLFSQKKIERSVQGNGRERCEIYVAV